MLIRADKMYQNPFTPGYEVLSKSGYNIGSHGSLSNIASYLVTNDVPDYAGMFYSPTEHEVMTSIKYGNFEQGYDNLNEIRESLNGPPIEFYVPSSVVVPDGIGKQDRTITDAEETKNELLEKVNKESLQEITKAQKQVSKKIKKIEFEDVLLLRKIKRTIVFEEEDF